MTPRVTGSPRPLVDHDHALPPPESEYATTPAVFTCASCSHSDEAGTVCTFKRWSRPPPFKVDPDACCRYYHHPGMRVTGTPEGLPPTTRPLHVASATEPTGNPRRERKPTETHLERLIAAYMRTYLEASMRATDAAVEVLEQSGPINTRVDQAREAYLAELLVILDALRALAADAVRIGAARRWDPTVYEDRIETLVDQVVPRLVEAREAWLRKMANDFVSRIVVPVLEAEGPGPAREPPTSAPPEGMASTSSPSFVARDAPEIRIVLEDAERVLEFPRDVLKNLKKKGYRFGKVRAVEATEYDLWTGDDLGYIEASRQDGVQGFRWRTSEDPLVCPVCDALDLEVYTPAEAEMASADRGSHTHCRCRCWFEAIEPDAA